MKFIMSISCIILSFNIFVNCSGKTSTIAGSGTIEVDQIRISPLYIGRIKDIVVNEGDSFIKGQPLVHLQNEEIQADVDYSRAGLDAAKKGVDQARADYGNSRRERIRAEDLFRAGSLARQDIDRLRTKEQIALSRWQASRSQSAQLEAVVRRSQSRMDEITLYAPIDGVVLSRNFEVGEVVLPGASILSIANLNSVRLNVYVPGPELSQIVIGANAIVTVDGSDQEWQGKIESISDKAEFTPKNVQTADARARLVYEVRIRIQNKDSILKPGMPADAVIELKRSESIDQTH
ncbi:MAG: efflux RND transporter periplasmic adaptor subunit [Leptonema sp. (in: Bacteria)]|nr:efflux RND transporter periplasmic adaptor subunit [Leptonema sp. (in: bacteria)]